MCYKVAIITRPLAAQGHSGWVVGGAVRDILNRRTPKDLDMVTTADTATILRLFGGVRVGNPPHCTVTTHIDGQTIEIASCAETGLRQDLARRDFTVNAMALTPEGELIDPFGGQEDLRHHILRFTGSPEERLREDPVRALRAARFAAIFGFALHKTCSEAILAFPREKKIVTAQERIGKEVRKALPCLSRFLRIADELHLFASFFPFLEALRGLPQDAVHHPEGDALTHTFLAVEEAERVTDPVLRVAALFHDIGKAYEADSGESGRFFRHEARGAEVAEEILTAWNWPREQRERIVALVALHMRPLFPLGSKGAGRIYRQLGQEGTAQLLSLAEADIRSSSGDMTALEANRPIFVEVAQRIERTGKRGLLSGREVMELLGLPPGPAIGKALEALEDAVAEGVVSTQEEARIWLGQNLILPTP